MPLTGLAKTCWQSSSLYRGVLYRFHLLHCKGALCKENEGTLSPWMKHTPGTEHRRVRRAAHPASCPQTHKGERVISSKVSPPGPWVKHLSTRGFKMPQFSPCLCTGWICRGHSGNVSAPACSGHHMGTPGLSTASTGEGISPNQVQTDPNATAMMSEPFTAKQLAAQLHAAEDRLLLPGCLCFLCWLPIAVDNFKSNQTAARTGVPVGDMLSSLCGGCCAATTPAAPPGAII